jgi:predicted secreted protein
MRLLLVTCVTVLGLLATGCGADAPAPTGHGREFPATTTPHISIKNGERFSVVVEENASVGDRWQIKGGPDPKIARTEPDDYVADAQKNLPGGGGKRYFVFTATGPGISAIELFNCFRGCQNELDKQRSTSYAIQLTVT